MEILKGMAFIMTSILVVDFLFQASKSNKSDQDAVVTAGMIKWKL